ncbi:hypothetical protein NDU88_011333 [Pleurodeles waltl]|uniref:Uncharacterized protein n=1 Tax=Pleurodeles waltl TaxID=8319 RepID=A0AAV7S5V8_PLEWA|nr:hypothetical protein NDU88_011333 [Pleurodeles waltl]
MSHARRRIAVRFASSDSNNKPWHTQNTRLAKVDLTGTRKDQVDSTQEGESEGALRNTESPQKPRQHPQESHRPGTRRSRKRPTQHYKKGSHVSGEPLRELCVAGWSAGGWSFKMPEDLVERMPTSRGSCKGCSAQGYCPAWAGKGLPPPKLESWKRGPSGPLQYTTYDAGSTPISRRGDPHSQSSSQSVPAEAGE